MGQIESPSGKVNTALFMHLCKELEPKGKHYILYKVYVIIGTLTMDNIYDFNFNGLDRLYNSYDGQKVKLR